MVVSVERGGGGDGKYSLYQDIACQKPPCGLSVSTL